MSRIFLKPNRFWFQKNDGKNIIIINAIYMKPGFPITKKIARKL